MSHPPNGPERRKTRLVDTPTQRRVLLTVGKALWMHFVIFGALVTLVAPGALVAGDLLRADTLPEAASELLLALSIPALCCFLGLFAHAILHAGRIVGPCYRFQAVAADLGRLRVPRGLRVRRDDHLLDTAAALDQGLAAVHDGIARVQAEARAAVALLEAEPSFDGGATPELRERIDALHQAAAAFELVGQAPQCARPASNEPESTLSPAPVESL